MRLFLTRILPGITLVVALGLSSFLAYSGYRYKAEQEARYRALASTTDALFESTQALGRSVAYIENNLALTRQENSDLANTLSDNLSLEKDKVASVEEKLAKVSGTVGTLDKLSKTDPQLLQKYSKVFFLNEHYIPLDLASVDKKYLYHENRAEELIPEVMPHLTKMLDDAAAASTTIYVESAYRSFYEQAALKTRYSVVYGAGTANKFSADQGYSEHQLGTTADFITPGLGGSLTGFEKTNSYAWLLSNAYKYGFILSYPKDNGYYIYEPWHWRFVGVALATKLHDDRMNFYDMDQRVIDQYLVSIFD